MPPRRLAVSAGPIRIRNTKMQMHAPGLTEGRGARNRDLTFLERFSFSLKYSIS